MKILSIILQYRTMSIHLSEALDLGKPMKIALPLPQTILFKINVCLIKFKFFYLYSINLLQNFLNTGYSIRIHLHFGLDYGDASLVAL